MAEKKKIYEKMRSTFRDKDIWCSTIHHQQSCCELVPNISYVQNSRIHLALPRMQLRSERIQMCNSSRTVVDLRRKMRWFWRLWNKDQYQNNPVGCLHLETQIYSIVSFQKKLNKIHYCVPGAHLIALIDVLPTAGLPGQHHGQYRIKSGLGENCWSK